MKFFIKLQKTGLPTFLRSPAFLNLMTLPPTGGGDFCGFVGTMKLNGEVDDVIILQTFGKKVEFFGNLM